MEKLMFFCVAFLVTLWGSSKLAESSAILSASMDLCGPETEIELTKSGETSSMIVTLSPIEHNSICKLRVTAPKTHVIYMQFLESGTEIRRALMSNKTERHPPCVMSILLPQNPRIPVWKGDPCSTNSIADIDLLTPEFKILWGPPSKPAFTKGRKIVLTAVGQDQICKEPGQHTCMKIGWDPVLCVSDYLLCDGITNCPKSASTSDEDDKLCKSHLLAQTSWEQLAVEIFKKLKPPTDVVNNNKWLHDKLEKHGFSSPPPEEMNETETTTQKRVMQNKPKATDAISQVLSKYGPWGYLMLGMLICGTVLMLCGIWECCFRRPKTEMDELDPPSRTQPTTVLVINEQDERTSPSPPNYDDLDLPPSYTTLFPNLKPSEDTPQSSGTTTDIENDSENSNTNPSGDVTSQCDGDNVVSRDRNSEERVDET